MKTTLLHILTQGKAGLAYLATGVFFAIGAGLQVHHVDWWVVGGVACTAAATICHSAVPSWLEKTAGEPPADVSKN